uniref:Secreted protein n=1 Tax=Romanomermis culicivorax TaxID=13658 RepID=A0A915JVJ0_ROMCU
MTMAFCRTFHVFAAFCLAKYFVLAGGWVACQVLPEAVVPEAMPEQGQSDGIGDKEIDLLKTFPLHQEEHFGAFQRVHSVVKS